MAIVDVTKPRPHVSLITLNNPNRVNAMSFELVQGLYDALAQVEKDNETWVVVMNGAGKGFCSGLDLTDVGLPPDIEGLPMSRIAIRAMHFMADIVPTMRNLPQPIIAAIHGAAWGGGFCLALGADIRLAARSARFCGAGIVNGLTGTELGASYLLPRLVGASRANEIILSGREVDALEADRIGLVSRVVEDGSLLDEAYALAEKICEYSPHGVSMTKRLLWSSWETGSLAAAIDHENRNQLLVRMTTNNLDEFIRARKEGRKPRYED
jgi:enoyl-CoA hydratase